jgi:O-antigen/teichoic acid export membrane protein
LIIVIYLSISFPFSIFAAIVTANERFVFQKILAIARSLITPLLMIPLLLLGYKSIAMAAIAVVVGTTITSVNVWYCFKKIKIKIVLKNFDFLLLKEIFWFSVFVFAKMILERIYWSSGQFMLGASIGTIAVAIFSVALQMKGYYESFSQAIGNLFLPRLTSMVAAGDAKSQITATFVKVGRIQFHILGFILCVYILIGEKFIIFWAGKNYVSAYWISLFIMIPYTLPLIQSIGNSLIQAYNVQRPLVITFLINTILTIMISYLLMHTYGAKGCAIALAIAIVIGEVIIMNWFYWKRLGINIPLFWKEIARIAIVMVCLTFVFKYIITFFIIKGLFSLVSFVLIFAIIYFPVIYFVAMNTYEKELVLSLFKSVKPKSK